MPDNTQDFKKELLSQYQDQIHLLKKEIETLDKEILISQLRNEELLIQKNRIVNLGRSKTKLGIELKTSIEVLGVRIKAAKIELGSKKRALSFTIQQMVDYFPPEFLSDNLFDKGTPVILFPMRMETRYMLVRWQKQGSAVTRSKSELWVRAFPDQIFLESHEDILTKDELEQGKKFWSALYDFGIQGMDFNVSLDKKNMVLGEWRRLASNTGPKRGAHIVHYTKPGNFGTTSSQPDFSNLEDHLFKKSGWTAPPKTHILPDCLYFITKNNKGEEQRYMGKAIPNPLIMGIDPFDSEGFFNEGDEELEMPDYLKWMTDFDYAVNAGLGIRIPLESINDKFKSIKLIGLKFSASIEESSILLEEKLREQRFSEEGLSLLPFGVPTNNTEERNSMLNENNFGADTVFQKEIWTERMLGEQGTIDSQMSNDGQWLANSLGISSDLTTPLLFSEKEEINEAMILNELLWPVTLGRFFKEALNLDDSIITKLRYFFLNFVSARGFVPLIRTDTQPYGVIPTTDFSSLSFKPTSANDFSFENNLLENILKPLSNIWKGFFEAEYPLSDDEGQAQGPELIELLEKQASTSQINTRNSKPSGLKDELKSLFSAPVIEKIDNFNNLVFSTSGDNGRELEMVWSETSESNPLPLLEGTDKNYLDWLLDIDVSGNEINSTPFTKKSPPLLFSLLLASKKKQTNPSNFEEKLRKISTLPTMKLQRLLAEHIDLCSYRLDAWKQGLVNFRLFSEIRDKNSTTGNYLGAYSWLENLEVSTNHGEWQAEAVKDPNNHTPGALVGYKLNYAIPQTITAAPQKVEDEDPGFLQAPSILQALTSATLRSAYESNKEALSINLDSKRVRIALFYLKGLQNQQTLRDLLGYSFEESLLEDKNLNLARFVWDIRRFFSENDPENLKQNVIPNNVVNGIALIKAFKEKSTTSSKWRDLENLIRDQIQNSSSQENPIPILQSIQNAAEIILSHLDAFTDLCIAESVFQAGTGNQVKMKGMLDFLSDLKDQWYPPNPEFIKTKRESDVVHHKLMLVFPEKNNPNIWTKEGTPRSLMQPQLNHWLATCFGRVEGLFFEVMKEGITTNEKAIQKVFLKDLNLEPIDLLYLLGPNIDLLSFSEFHTLVYAQILQENPTEPVWISLQFMDNQASSNQQKPLFEIFSIISHCWSLVQNSRSLEEKDFYIPGQNLLNETENLNFEHLEKVSIHLNTYVGQLSSIFENILSGANKESISGTTNFIKEYLKIIPNLNGLGISTPIHLRHEENITGSHEEWTQIIEKVEKNLQKLKTALQELIDGFIDKELSFSNLEMINKRLKSFIVSGFGRSFKLFGRFALKNHQSFHLALDHTRNGKFLSKDNPLQMDDWIYSNSMVQEKVKPLQLLKSFLFLNEDANSNWDFVPVQLPVEFSKDGEIIGQWLGDQFSPSYDPPDNALSMVGNFPPNFDVSKGLSGMLIDSWHEHIPRQKAKAGVALKYNTPDNAAPQAILLSIPPELDAPQSWKSICNSIDETMKMAKIRAVNPATVHLNIPFLPAIILDDETLPTN